MRTLTVVLLLSLLSCQQESPTAISVDGLQQEVEVIRDEYGINHIYAQNQRDLFFAQGYCAAKDRLFQFEIWRRQATGTVAELLGERELQRDIGTRLFKYRGDMIEEMNYYHEDGEEIITAYVDGVNAYIAEMQANPELRPETLKALGTMPEKWTPDVVISRHQGLLGNIGNELAIGQAVQALGVDKVKKYLWLHPKDPKLDLDPRIADVDLSDEVLGLYNAYRRSVSFLPADVLPEYRAESTTGWLNDQMQQVASNEEDQDWIGSNNWVTRPNLAANGHGYMANDPHRTLAIPSLRYWTHLSAPGWNVIGGGEPEIPGISIGHNEHGAWGLTVYRTDGEDLYIYDLNPANLNQYQYEGQWVDMNIITEDIPVKGQEPVSVDFRYTRHGPVTFIDSTALKAYAVRCAWMEPGGSPYLASLRMDQATTWEEFREACNYSHIPGENMVWADKEGNIGWQAVGIAPLRRNWSGLVPVPGDGSYEWDGYLPIKQKPNLYNPSEGFLATANEHVTPDHYTEWDAIGFSWSDPFRGDRIREVLAADELLTMEDMQRLQTDYLSLPARTLVPMVMDLASGSMPEVTTLFEEWDYRLETTSAAAALYASWENRLRQDFFDYFPDPEAEPYISGIQLASIIRWLEDPASFIASGREDYLMGTLRGAVTELKDKFGENTAAWAYGHEDLKHVKIEHPLSNAVSSEWQERINAPVLPRGGNQYTPGATGSSWRQRSGATFKIIVDVNDWDQSVGMNSPGQSGNPDSPFYKNLYGQWAQDQYFPVLYTRELVEQSATSRTLLRP